MIAFDDGRDHASRYHSPPRKGDVLFRGDLPDLENTALLLNELHGGDDQYIAEGYLRGAKLLVQHVLDAEGHKNFLVYPIIFLYRHHLELAFKRILRRSPRLLGRALTQNEKTHLGQHKLDLLWQDLKPLFSDICNALAWEDEPEAADVEGVDNYIRQLSKVDPDSYSFRYSHSKTGDPSLPKELNHINLRHFAEMMDRLVNYVDLVDTATSMYEEWRDEMQSEPGYEY